MADLDESLNDWFEEISKATDLTISEKTRITGAGAKVLANELSEATRQKHYRPHKDGASDIHLANSITYQENDIDGEKNGHSTVGFKYKKGNGTYNKAFIARFLNDGTVKIQGDHFFDNARNSAASDVFAAERKEYRRIMKER